jgi:hypothetical protein
LFDKSRIDFDRDFGGLSLAQYEAEKYRTAKKYYDAKSYDDLILFHC